MVERFNRNIFSKGTVTYTDIDLSFKSNPVTGDVRKKVDIDSIKQSLKNLLFTDKGERPFQPFLYGGLNDLLFEPLDNITTGILEDQIRTVIANHEPRITVIRVKVDSEKDRNELNVSIQFNMVNVLEPQTINIILKRK